MSSFYVHFCWFSFLGLLSCFMALLSLYVAFTGSFYVSASFFSSYPLFFPLSLYLDLFSSIFLTVVLLISSVIMIYSFFYMSPYFNSHYFLSLTVLFVLSMCLVISISNFCFIMLGWDGLGVVSFFLIVYYQNQSSIFSGLFTLLINRFGDGLFLCCISLYLFCSYDLFVFSSLSLSPVCLFFLVSTFMTKSAIYPFSPWLPIAIAAPTPISALVHSSTLVTSGLFLIIKFSYIIYSSYTLCYFLIVFCLFTSFYAGVNTVFENDLNNLIALSTLSHLGFIGISFSLGFLSLSFFHLLSHALFNSLLFMTIGDIIINMAHSQDIRFLSSGIIYTPFSCSVMFVSLINLMGIPSLVGYFSKDLVLEACNFSSMGSFLYLVLLVNLMFTFYYTFQLFYYSFSFNKFTLYASFHSPIVLHSVLLLSLSTFSLSFGYFYLSYIFYSPLFLPLPLYIKSLPIIYLFTFFILLFFSLSLFTSHSQLLNSYFSTMMFLYFFITNVMSRLYYSFTFSFVKTFELGILNFTLNTKLPTFISYLGYSVLSLSLHSLLLVSLFLSFFSMLLFIF